MVPKQILLCTHPLKKEGRDALSRIPYQGKGWSRPPSVQLSVVYVHQLIVVPASHDNVFAAKRRANHAAGRDPLVLRIIRELGHLGAVHVDQVRLLGVEETSRDEDHVRLELDNARVPGAVGKYRAVEKDFAIKDFRVKAPKMSSDMTVEDFLGEKWTFSHAGSSPVSPIMKYRPSVNLTDEEPPLRAYLMLVK